MSILKIALTGGIACGKSEVSQVFSNLGINIIDLDEIAKTVVEPQKPELQKLVHNFGSHILNPDKTLNRQILRDKLLASKKNQQLIQSILHPKIIAKMQADIAKIKHGIVIVVVPLLVECNMAQLFDRTIIVDCNRQDQLKRLLKRGNIDKNTAQKIILSQASRQERLNLHKKLPVDIINNNSNLASLKQKTKDLYQKLLND